MLTNLDVGHSDILPARKEPDCNDSTVRLPTAGRTTDNNDPAFVFQSCDDLCDAHHMLQYVPEMRCDAGRKIFEAILCVGQLSIKMECGNSRHGSIREKPVFDSVAQENDFIHLALRVTGS